VVDALLTGERRGGEAAEYSIFLMSTVALALGAVRACGCVAGLGGGHGRGWSADHAQVVGGTGRRWCRAFQVAAGLLVRGRRVILTRVLRSSRREVDLRVG
jgi:hypothetical protein